MDSLYGGHQGVSFIIKDSFESIEEAVAACKLGPQYTRCWYGENIIISTPNLNDEDNGKVFNRGLDYTNDMGGLVFIAQIVGPAGGTPIFEMGTLQETKYKSTMPIEETDYRKYPIGYDTNDDGEIIGYKLNTNANEPIATFPFSQAHHTSLVPGKTAEGAYNDEILWTWVNIRKANQTADSMFYVGFQIPYLVTEYLSHMVSPYDTFGNLNRNPTTATRVDDASHPFYSSWDIGVPKGIKGDTMRALRVITPTAENRNNIYAPSAITVNSATGAVTIGNAGYDGLDDDITNDRKHLGYDFYSFDNQLNPDPVLIYLGDFNKIDNISLADDGTLTIDYSHDDNTVFSRKIKWITDTVLSPDSGVFTVTYNNGDPAFTTTLDWIKQINLDNDGTIHFIHTKDNRDESYSNKIKWVTSVDLNTANGTFTMNFNYGSPLVRILDYVDSVVFNEENGEITVHHVNSGNKVMSSKMKLITSAEASTDGVVTFHTNTGESFNIKRVGSEENFQIRTVENIRLNTRLADDKHIQIKYNNANEYTNIGDPINYIQDMVVRESDFHLLVLYNDPEHRSTGAGLDDEGVDAEGNTWVNNVVGSDGVNTGASIYWRDYGTIKDQSGVLIGMDISNEEVGDQDILDYLNATYPNGLTEGATRQKIVTYSPDGSGSREFYAFDYNTYTWYFLGTIADSGMRDAKLVTVGSFTNADLTSVNPDGLVFKVVNATNLKTTAIPDFWSPSYDGWV